MTLDPSRTGPARGLAICPLCTDLPLTRPRCTLCSGLGFVARQLRNAWKRGAR